MARVGIVTDSTCDLPPEELEALGVVMVPLKVLFGEDSYLDWVELQPEEFFERLRNAPVLPKTSQPSPAEFASAYQRLADDGVEAIVSIHLSAALSGTFESAMMAAKDAPVPVHVVDTKRVSQGVAMAVKAALAERDAGADAEPIAARARWVSENSSFFFVLDTLDYLVKGGRAGKAAGLAASLLNIKPVLAINDDGIIEPYAKERGRKKAFQALATHVAEVAAQKGRMRVALFHACAPDVVRELQETIVATGADIELESIGLIGAVIGTYAGPAAVGLSMYPVG